MRSCTASERLTDCHRVSCGIRPARGSVPFPGEFRMALKVAINGFGRIGRLVVRAAKTRGVAIDFVAVNDLTDAATLAHLLKYDTVHRVWHEASSRPVDGKLVIAGDAIAVSAEKDPAKLPWKALGVDVVLESTGRFTDRDQAAVHLHAGAKSVL